MYMATPPVGRGWVEEGKKTKETKKTKEQKTRETKKTSNVTGTRTVTWRPLDPEKSKQKDPYDKKSGTNSTGMLSSPKGWQGSFGIGGEEVNLFQGWIENHDYPTPSLSLRLDESPPPSPLIDDDEVEESMFPLSLREYRQKSSPLLSTAPIQQKYQAHKPPLQDEGPFLSSQSFCELEGFLLSHPRTDGISGVIRSMCDQEGGIPVKKRASRFRSQRKCFMGQKAVSWMVGNSHAKNRIDAVNLGDCIYQMGFITRLGKNLESGSFGDDRDWYFFTEKCHRYLNLPIDDEEEIYKFEVLPEKVIVHICQYLPAFSLCSLCQTNKRFRSITERDDIWKPLYFNYFKHHNHTNIDQYFLAQKGGEQQEQQPQQPQQENQQKDEGGKYKEIYQACYLQESKYSKPQLQWEKKGNETPNRKPIKNLGKLVTGFLHKNYYQCDYGVHSPPSLVSPLHLDFFCVVVVGAPNSGKSTFLHSFFGGNKPRTETIAANLQKHNKCINGVHVGFQAWELSGRERFKIMLPMYLRHALAVIVTFDPWDRYSLEITRGLLRTVRDKSSPNADILVCSTKEDKKETGGRLETYEFTRNRMEDFLKRECPSLTIQEVSAKTNPESIENIFNSFVKKKVEALSLLNTSTPENK